MPGIHRSLTVAAPFQVWLRFGRVYVREAGDPAQAGSGWTKKKPCREAPTGAPRQGLAFSFEPVYCTSLTRSSMKMTFMSS
jgi:hypothetical protein